MTKRQLRLFILVLTGLVSLLIQQGWVRLPQPAPQFVSSGFYKVVTVHDGDTISVDMNGREEKVRFIGVDTPETHDPRKAVECFGQAASAFTSSLLGDGQVRLEADELSSNRDRYDRLLRYVYLPDNRLVNAELIRQGFGFAYTSFPFTKLDEFRTLETRAKAQNRGLWRDCSPGLDERGFIHSNAAAP